MSKTRRIVSDSDLIDEFITIIVVGGKREKENVRRSLSMQHSRQLDSAPKFPAREQGNQRRRGNTLTPELIIRLSLRKLLISNSRLETLHRLQLHYLANSRSEQRELHANSCMPRTFVSRQSIYARSINDRCRSHIPRKLLSPAHDKFCSLRLRKIVISLRGGRARGRLSYTAAFI